MIEEILTNYINFIRGFETLISNKYGTPKTVCKITGSPFERKGTIDGIDYWFHGSGCTAEKDGVIYAYDISILGIQFSQWKITELIRTHPRYQKLNYSEDYIEYELYQLINKGVLDWLIIEGIEGTSFGCVFKSYRVIQEPLFV